MTFALGTREYATPLQSVREVVRLAEPGGTRAGHDYVLVGRRAALATPFARMRDEFDGALRRVHAGRQGHR